jgi:DUF4097 and DUF4098 domain-containing protein YvlB
MKVRTLFIFFWIYAFWAGQSLWATPKASSFQTEKTAQQKLERGGQVTVQNPKGEVVIQGWDQETVEVVATRHGKPVSVDVSQTAPNQVLITPSPRSSSEVLLDIKVPRYAEIKSVEAQEGIKVTGVSGGVRLRSSSGDLDILQVGPLSASTASGDIRADGVSGKAMVSTSSGNIQIQHAGSVEAKVSSGDVTILDVDGAATVKSNSGKITTRNISGDLWAKTTSGGVMAENIKGLVNASSSSEGITVRNAGGDVKAIAISGDLRVECTKGRVESNTVSGSILLTGIGGDVEATTTSGDVQFAGAVRPSGRYRLKSFSGKVRMGLAEPVPGFTVNLSTYSGEIETDFALTVESPEHQGAVNRRLMGRYGDGQTQISMESFSGGIQLKKGTTAKTGNCP